MEDNRNRIENITSRLKITKDFIIVNKGMSGLTSIDLDYEFIWRFNLPFKLGFENLNHISSYRYNIRLNLENYSDDEIIIKINKDLKNIKSELEGKQKLNSLSVKCFIRNALGDSLGIDIK